MSALSHLIRVPGCQRGLVELQGGAAVRVVASGGGAAVGSLRECGALPAPIVGVGHVPALSADHAAWLLEALRPDSSLLLRVPNAGGRITAAPRGPFRGLCRKYLAGAFATAVAAAACRAFDSEAQRVLANIDAPFGSLATVAAATHICTSHVHDADAKAAALVAEAVRFVAAAEAIRAGAGALLPAPVPLPVGACVVCDTHPAADRCLWRLDGEPIAVAARATTATPWPTLPAGLASLPADSPSLVAVVVLSEATPHSS